MEIVVIIPAFNEEKTIGDVLYVVKQVDIINEIIVVSDGSVDNTAKIAKNFGVDVIELKDNVGKGGAIKAGLNCCRGDIVLLLDADLVGLNKNHVLSLLEPVIGNRAQMSVGIFSDGRFLTDLAQRFAPYLSGQRAVRRSILDDISNMDMTRYGIEVVLTQYVKKKHIAMEKVILKEMTHCMKEEKLGLYKGMYARFKMYGDILKCLTYNRVR